MESLSLPNRPLYAFGEATSIVADFLKNGEQIPEDVMKTIAHYAAEADIDIDLVFHQIEYTYGINQPDV